MIRVAILFFLFVVAESSIRGKRRFISKHASKEKGNPMMARIIEMLAEEKDKIKTDIQVESKTMADYMGYCNDDQSEKAYAIKTATRKINDRDALVADNTAQIGSLEEEIAELGAEIAERQEEMDKADKVRADAHEEFKLRESEQIVCVEELEKMSIELKRQMEAMTTPPPVPVPGEEEAGAAGFIQDSAGAAGSTGSIQDLDDSDFYTAETLFRKRGPESLLQKHAGKVNKHTVLTQNMLNGANIGELLRVMEKTVNSFTKNIDDQSKGSFLQTLGRQKEDPLSGLGQSAGGENRAGPAAAEKEDPNEQLKAFEGLKKKAFEALKNEREGEMNAKQAHLLNKQDLTHQLHLLEDKVADCKKDKTELTEEKENALAEIAELSEVRGADEKYLKELVTECTDSSHAWDVRQSEAKAEMAAIDKAKEILASRVVVFAQTTTVTKRTREPTPAVNRNEAKLRQTLINHFRNLGKQIKSLSMVNMASAVAAQPLAKVKGLISDLIAKLEKEAAEQADTHAFCQEEKKKNEETIKKHGAKIDLLQARLDKANAKKTQLAAQVEELTAEVASIAQTQAEATKIRNEEKATYDKAHADFSEAADAVTDAVSALQDYYGDTTSFVQVNNNKQNKKTFVQVAHKQPQGAPELGGAKADSGSIIIGMLETMGQEFAETAANLENTEHGAVEAYEKLTQENKVATSAKETAIKGAKSEIATLDVTIGHFTDDHTMTKKELAAVHEYVLSLKPTCYGRVQTYAERQAKIATELEGLQTALRYLVDFSPESLPR